MRREKPNPDEPPKPTWAEDWNARHPVGTRVRWWPCKKFVGPGTEAVTLEPAYMVFNGDGSSHAFVRISGRALAMDLGFVRVEDL